MSPAKLSISVFLGALMLLSCHYSNGQIAGKQEKEVRLHDLLDSLQKSGSSIAYSRDKLANAPVTSIKTTSLKSLLQVLESRKILAFTESRGLFILSPYIPKKYNLHGMLKDQKTGEHLIGATIKILESSSGAITNGYGYFNLTLPEGEYAIEISYLGYQSKTETIVLDKDVYLRLGLNEKIRQLEEIEISSTNDDINIISSEPSAHRIRLSETAKSIPYLLGEVDVIQNALLHPGIKAVGEDASGIHVRGGNVDQNLTLLDEAIIYNPNHFYGLISVFNPEAVNDVKILKGFIPPSYGGRSSSVIEVRQKEGNNQRLSASGGVGLLSARGLIEGPITKGKSSFLVSARQSLLNLSLEDFGSTSVRRNRIRFQDINMKLNLRSSDKNTYYLSGYLGNDRNTAGFNSVRNWGNRMLNFRWNHLYSPRLFSNVSAFVSEYNYRIENDTDPGAFVSQSKIANYSLKSDFDYHIAPDNDLTFGISTIFHRLIPGIRQPLEETDDTNTLELDTEHAFETAFYLGHQFRKGKFSVHYGLRYSMLHNLGPGEVFNYRDNVPSADSSITDTTRFSSGSLIKFYDNFEPRASLSYIINNSTSVKASYAKTAQYIHLISNTIAPAPTDIWKLSDTYIPPGTTEHLSLGIYKNILENTWELNIEGYYKNIQNSIQYRNGADLVFNQNLETELLYSPARAYGIEFYAAKKKGKFQGWMSYSLSRAETNLAGQTVLLNHDKTHDFSTSWNYQATNRFSFSSNFIWNTGIPVTLPTDKYFFEGNLIPQFSDRNNARLPTYHRLDLSLQLKGKNRKKDGSIRKNQDNWVLTVYNVYARKNTYSYFFRASEADPTQGEVVKFSIFGTAIPAITYNFKF